MRSAKGVVWTAANIRDGDNPPYDIESFREVMPAFTDDIIPATVLDMYIQMADAVVKKTRWHQLWPEGMRLFIAHFATLYIAGQPIGDDPQSIVASAANRGMASSKTVDAISISYDLSTVAQDLEGWGTWKETTFGSQFATLARMIAKGGMYVQ